MKYTLSLILSLFLILPAIAQDTLDGQPVYGFTEKMPTYPGGQTGLMKALTDTLSYPKEALRNRATGIVYVKFVVDKNGNTRDAKVVKGAGFGMDEEALKAIQTLNSWIPGQKDGQNVNVYQTLPVRFNMEIQGLDGQVRNIEPPDYSNDVFIIVENKPEPVGGYEEYGRIISKNRNYPEEAIANKKGGKVYVQFIVDETGTPVEVKAVKPAGYGMDEEAVRLISMIKWIPGKQRGQEVKVRMVMPVVFPPKNESWEYINGDFQPKPVTPSIKKPKNTRVDPADYQAFMDLRVKPNYDGLSNQFFADIKEYLKYPEEAEKNLVTGVVKVGFTIDEKGKMTNIKLLEGAGHGLDEAALHLANNLRDWSPAKDGRKKVPVDMVLSVVFDPEVYPFMTTRVSNMVLSESEHNVRMDNVDPEIIYDTNPIPAGGMKGWAEYLRVNMRYPTNAKRAGIEGKVYVQFKVDTDGSIKDVKAVNGIGGGCDEEAERIVRNSPKWNPAEKEGNPVPAQMVLPIIFKLSK